MANLFLWLAVPSRGHRDFNLCAACVTLPLFAVRPAEVLDDRVDAEALVVVGVVLPNAHEGPILERVDEEVDEPGPCRLPAPAATLCTALADAFQADGALLGRDLVRVSMWRGGGRCGTV